MKISVFCAQIISLTVKYESYYTEGGVFFLNGELPQKCFSLIEIFLKTWSFIFWSKFFVVKYTKHKIAHLSHVQLHISVVLSAFTVLNNHCLSSTSRIFHYLYPLNNISPFLCSHSSFFPDDKYIMDRSFTSNYFWGEGSRNWSES